MSKALIVVNFVVAALAIMVFTAFFLPWANVEPGGVGTVSKFLGVDAHMDIKSISGYMVPKMANGPDAKLAMLVFQILCPGLKDADKKSFLIWVVPLLAMAMAIAIFSAGGNKWVNLAVAAIGIAVFIVGVYKIETTDLNKLVLDIHIGRGLWLTFWGYLGIGIAALANLALSKRK